jgi:hypothetical protein
MGRFRFSFVAGSVRFALEMIHAMIIPLNRI